MKNKKVVYLALFVLLVCALIITAFSFYQAYMSRQPQTPFIPAIQSLMSSDAEFQKGMAAMDNPENTTDEIAHFRASLEQHRGTTLEVPPKFLLATNLGWAANPNTVRDPLLVESIGLFKEIVANPTYHPGMRASALQAMERLLSSAHSANVRALLIESEPYKSFDADGTLRTLQKNILTYAETLYPLPAVETKLADLYTMDMLEYVKSTPQDSTAKASIEEKQVTIKQFIAKGDASIARLASYPLSYKEISSALLLKALTAQHYFEATSESPFGDVETLYKEALTSAEQSDPNKLPSLTLYYYAAYLSTLGPDRQEETKVLLRKIYTRENYLEKAKEGLLATEVHNIVGEKQNIVRLAAIDPDFKALLLKLGWTEQDFAPVNE